VPQLVVIAGPDAGRVFPLTADAVVGRLSTNPVCLSDPRASRKHFEIHLTRYGVELVDLGSGNGTRLNGVAVQSAELRNGDQIRIGDTTLRYDADGSRDDKTRIVVRSQPELPSAVVRTLTAEEGSRVLTHPAADTSDWLRGRLATLAVLYETTAAVSSIADVDELLGRIVELVIRTTDADHGCAMLLDPDGGGVLPKAARSRGGGGELVVSRTVVDHVLRANEGVLITDAGADERFRTGASVMKHHLREVICVPLKGRRETVGVLFLDTFGDGEGLEPRFTPDHLRLAAAVAHQAAIAVEETKHFRSLVQAERLAAVGQAIADLSHHIKNIMQGVRFGADMVRAGLAGDDKQLLVDGWRLVEKNQRRIDELILDMLSYSKDREPILEPADLRGIAADVLELVLGRAGGTGVSLELSGGDLPPVPCDAEAIHRALLNVVGNAVDVLADVPDPRVVVEVGAADGFAEIRVTDNGPGVPADKREEIFKPFVSTKGSRGTGLGLPSARKTLREHGGDLFVLPTDEPGATFVLRLPLSTGEPAA
jgi:signal transduction histidine kinase